MTGLLLFGLLGAGCWVLFGAHGLARLGFARRGVDRNATGARPTAASRRRLLSPAGRGPASPDPQTVDTALMIDLLGAILTAGAPIGVALTVLADSCPPSLARGLRGVAGSLTLGADWEAAWSSAAARGDPQTGAVLVELSDALRFAALTGASSAGIVHAHAAQLRRRRNSAAELRAATLGVKLVVPLGLCYLPAFICLGVLPVVLALVPQWR